MTPGDHLSQTDDLNKGSKCCKNRVNIILFLNGWNSQRLGSFLIHLSEKLSFIRPFLKVAWTVFPLHTEVWFEIFLVLTPKILKYATSSFSNPRCEVLIKPFYDHVMAKNSCDWIWWNVRFEPRVQVQFWIMWMIQMSFCSFTKYFAIIYFFNFQNGWVFQ